MCESGEIVPFCGRYRGLINQIHDENYKCEVQLKARIVTIVDLLPETGN
ncbi:hypothetical protein [Tissierella praeacuta]